MNKNVVLLGAGGHAKVVFEALLSSKECNVTTCVSPIRDSYFNKLEYIGDENVLLSSKQKLLLVNGIGIDKDKTTRQAVYQKFKEHGCSFITVIHSKSSISPTAVLGEGVQVLALAIVQSCVQIGVNSIINNGAIVEHDVMVGDHCHICPGVILGGGSRVGNNVLIGSGAVILPGVIIADDVIVGAGAVVTKDILLAGVYVGVPATQLCSDRIST